MAQQAGIGRATLSRYERGELTPPADVLAALEMALDLEEVSPEWILFGDPEDAARPQPTILKNFGALFRIGFEGQGTADVAATSSDIRRLLWACAEHEQEKAQPNQELLDCLDTLNRHLFDPEIQVILRTVIAQHAVRLKPEIPKGEERKRNMTADASPGPDFSDPGGQGAPTDGGTERSEVTQTVQREHNQVAGRDFHVGGPDPRTRKKD